MSNWCFAEVQAAADPFGHGLHHAAQLGLVLRILRQQRFGLLPVSKCLLEFAGLLSHSGNAYRASSVSDLARIAEAERRTMAALAADLQALDVSVPDVSVGSTPSMSAVRALDGVTEVAARPYGRASARAQRENLPVAAAHER